MKMDVELWELICDGCELACEVVDALSHAMGHDALCVLSDYDARIKDLKKRLREIKEERKQP